MGLFDGLFKAAKEIIDVTGYNDIPDYAGYCPDCPQCGTEMKYSYSLSEFKCPSCGTILDENDWDREDDSEIPFGCASCGGPYPQCKTSCKMFDD